MYASSRLRVKVPFSTYEEAVQIWDAFEDISLPLSTSATTELDDAKSYVKFDHKTQHMFDAALLEPYESRGIPYSNLWLRSHYGAGLWIHDDGGVFVYDGTIGPELTAWVEDLLVLTCI